MSTNFYSSGFLYHAASQQILLQQNPTDPKPTWNLLGGTEEKDFRAAVKKLLKLSITPANIHKIYDYHHPVVKKKHFVAYAETKKLEKFTPTKGLNFNWFSMKEITKLPISSQSKQDIIVGLRVIGSSVRRAAGEQTIG